MDRFTAMRVFVETVDRGSLTAAAEALDLSRAVVTRHLGELEGWLGARLLHRTTRRLSLTDAGIDCLTYCRRVLGELDELRDGLNERSGEPQGTVRVTATPSFGRLLVPVFTEYVQRYPAAHVDLLLLDRQVNLVEERIDLAIRIGDDLDPTLVARRLSVCRSVICAAPAYLARCGTPQTVEELSRHNCLTYAYFGRSEWRFERDGRDVAVPVAGNLSANEVTVLAEAALAGAGVAMQPTYQVASHLRSGALVSILNDWRVPEKGIYGVYASHRFVPMILRSLIDHLLTRLGERPEWDEVEC